MISRQLAFVCIVGAIGLIACGLIVADVITGARAAGLLVAMVPAALAMWWSADKAGESR